MPQDDEELEVVRKIKEGKMRAPKDNETVDDAHSDWYVYFQASSHNLTLSL